MDGATSIGTDVDLLGDFGVLEFWMFGVIG